jgi:hypothetical protein
VTIINKKNITTSGFDADALVITTPGASMLNFGDLTTIGDLANGIYAGANNVCIRNLGDIETFGLGAAGIFASGSSAQIENDGTVSTQGGFYDPNPKVDGDETYSEGIFANGDRFQITNYGVVRVGHGEFSSCLIGIGTDGVVVNYGTVESVSDGSTVLEALGDRSQAINAGLLTTTGNDIVGIFALGDSSQVINTGRLTVTGDNDVGTLVRGEGGSAVNRGDLSLTGQGAEGMFAGPRNGRLINGGTIHITGDNSFGMVGLGDGEQIDNLGSIETHGTHAIGIEGLGSHPFPAGQNINVVNGGYINTEGDLAIGVALGLPIVPPGTATDASIVNTGAIESHGDGAAGVLIFGDGNHLTNSGQITTNGGAADAGVATLHAAGVVVSGDGTLVENASSGVIESNNDASAAVELNALKQNGLNNAKTSATLENYGVVKGASVAVLGGDGAEIVINHGHITGDVILGGGPDTFVFGSGGRLTGMLFLGGGNDRVTIERDSGSMTIADFVAGAAAKDIIDISAFYSNFTDLKAHSYQLGNDVVVGLGKQDQLVLAQVKLSALDTSDFSFVPTT